MEDGEKILALASHEIYAMTADFSNMISLGGIIRPAVDLIYQIVMHGEGDVVYLSLFFVVVACPQDRMLMQA